MLPCDSVGGRRGPRNRAGAARPHRVKHGDGQRRIDLDQVDVAAASDDETQPAVSEALDKLAPHDPQGAELIRLRFFGGLSYAEAGELLGPPERTAKRAWAYGRARLYDELKKTPLTDFWPKSVQMSPGE